MIDLRPEHIVAIVDTREQSPLDLSPLSMETGALETGDYSVRGLEHVIRIERKSLSDLIGCVGRDRDRFNREIQRLLAFPVRSLVIEAGWDEIEAGGWRGQVTPKMVLGALLSWQVQGLAIHCVGNHQRAGVHVGRLLYTCAKHRWRELAAFQAAIDCN